MKSLHAVSDDEVEMEAPESDSSVSSDDCDGLDKDGMMDDLDCFYLVIQNLTSLRSVMMKMIT